MTGEMPWIKSNGEASDGSVYSVHAKVAKALRSPLRPFDVYIGPYIAHKRGWLFLESEDGMIGKVVLWPGGQAPAYCKPVVVEYAPVYEPHEAIAAARQAVLS